VFATTPVAASRGFFFFPPLTLLDLILETIVGDRGGGGRLPDNKSVSLFCLSETAATTSSRVDVGSMSAAAFPPPLPGTKWPRRSGHSSAIRSRNNCRANRSNCRTPCRWSPVAPIFHRQPIIYLPPGVFRSSVTRFGQPNRSGVRDRVHP